MPYIENNDEELMEIVVHLKPIRLNVRESMSEEQITKMLEGIYRTPEQDMERWEYGEDWR